MAELSFFGALLPSFASLVKSSFFECLYIEIGIGKYIASLSFLKEEDSSAISIASAVIKTSSLKVFSFVVCSPSIFRMTFIFNCNLCFPNFLGFIKKDHSVNSSKSTICMDSLVLLISKAGSLSGAGSIIFTCILSESFTFRYCAFSSDSNSSVSISLSNAILTRHSVSISCCIFVGILY